MEARRKKKQGKKEGERGRKMTSKGEAKEGESGDERVRIKRDMYMNEVKKN